MFPKASSAAASRSSEGGGLVLPLPAHPHGCGTPRSQPERGGLRSARLNPAKLEAAAAERAALKKRRAVPPRRLRGGTDELGHLEGSRAPLASPPKSGRTASGDPAAGGADAPLGLWGPDSARGRRAAPLPELQGCAARPAAPGARMSVWLGASRGSGGRRRC